MSAMGGARVMKIRIEIGEDVSEDEIVIRCISLTPEIAKIQKLIKEGIKRIRVLFSIREIQEYFPVWMKFYFSKHKMMVYVHIPLMTVLKFITDFMN